jgi:hypothetical protein
MSPGDMPQLFRISPKTFSFLSLYQHSHNNGIQTMRQQFSIFIFSGMSSNKQNINLARPTVECISRASAVLVHWVECMGSF